MPCPGSPAPPSYSGGPPGALACQRGGPSAVPATALLNVAGVSCACCLGTSSRGSRPGRHQGRLLPRAPPPTASPAGPGAARTPPGPPGARLGCASCWHIPLSRVPEEGLPLLFITAGPGPCRAAPRFQRSVTDVHRDPPKARPRPGRARGNRHHAELGGKGA